ncbi:conserved hypothetical protein [Tenacibaculum sediminilitoris]|uniref:hypothetical protein n=1 Tax=Tenacibaculum sediminilitoris TaxID=1820334 RepID=UPI0038933F91
MIKRLKIETHNITFINNDATKHVIPTNSCPDIIVSEIIQFILDRKQQVSIFYNLMKQVNSNTFFITEKIALYIGTKSSQKNKQS